MEKGRSPGVRELEEYPLAVINFAPRARVSKIPRHLMIPTVRNSSYNLFTHPG
jgi:hypothetical protein